MRARRRNQVQHKGTKVADWSAVNWRLWGEFGMIADAGTSGVAEGETWHVTAILTEVLLGTWLLFLFMLALAWDPVDRWMGIRARRRVTRRVSQPATTVVDTREEALAA